MLRGNDVNGCSQLTFPPQALENLSSLPSNSFLSVIRLIWWCFWWCLNIFFLIIITPGRDFCVLSFKESVLAEFPKDQTHSGVLLWVCGCSHIFTRTVWVSWTSPQATGLRGPMASDQDLRGKPAVEPDAHQSAGAHQGAAAGLFFFFPFKKLQQKGRPLESYSLTWFNSGYSSYGG